MAGQPSGGTPDALLPQHAALLAASAIAPAVASARGYRSATTKAELGRLGFGAAQRRVPALLIPIHGVAGQIVNYQLRPDEPRIGRDGKPLKYETVAGSTMALDVPPTVRRHLGNPAVPLWITEGSRKADSAASKGLCCVALLGVWNFRGTNQHGGTTLLPDFEHVALNGRDVYVAFDSDVMTKPEVRAALERLKAALELRGANVLLVYLPAGHGGTKQGLDDFLAAGRGVDDLLALASPDLRRPPGGDDTVDDPADPYAVRDGRTWFRKRDRDGETWVKLADFSARIAEEVVADDGASERGELLIDGALPDGTPLPRARVPLGRFASLDWVVPAWGTRAVVVAGMGTKDRLREAIQRLSPDAARRREYAHPGWRRLDGRGWCYLSAGAVVGAGGAEPGVAVRLAGPAARLLLPAPPEGEALREAVRASLAVRDVAPDPVTAPLLGMAYRAPLNEAAYADLAGFVAGPTGVQKSELAALVQQHYGAGYDRLHLPASWAATATALERAAFDLKDAVAVIDDFAPTGSAHDVARYHATADRVLRGAGNAAGRGRMGADGSARPDYPPRGLVVGTGEDVPKGQSARARAVVVEVAPGDVDLGRLTACQEAGRRGAFAAATAGYLRWLAPQLDGLRDRLPARLAELRAALRRDGAHARTPEALANLAAGWELWLDFAEACGALDDAGREAAWRRAWAALCRVAAGQPEHQGGEEPVRRFLDLLASAVASGAAHVAGEDGEEPATPAAWGWRLATVGTGEYQREEWRAQGARVGWLAGEDLYLDLDAAYAAAQRVGQVTGSGLAVQPKTLSKRLHERGALRSTEQEQGSLKVRRTLEGKRRPVLHLAADALGAAEPRQSRRPGRGWPEEPPTGAGPGDDGGIPWPGAPPARTESRQEIPPGSAAVGANGRVGGIGGIAAGATVSAGCAGDGVADARGCFACGGHRFAPDGVCLTCHPRARAGKNGAAQ